MGDVVLALPLFHALRERFPAAELAWVVQSEFASLLEGLPGLARVIRFERRSGLRSWMALRAELAEFAPDLAIDAQGNLKSGFALACSAAPRRVGLARSDWREPLGRFSLTEAAAPSRGEHAFERTLALCRHFGAEGFVRRDAALTSAEFARAAQRANELGVVAGSLLVQLSPQSDIRAWPLARYAEFLRDAAQRSTHCVVLSGPSERREGEQLAALLCDSPYLRHWVGQRGLRELAAFFAVSAELGARYVGGDTGPTHLAAACGLPVTVLCGPHSHERTGPWPVAAPSNEASPHVAVRARTEPECAPCFGRACSHALGPVCMRDIEPNDVRMALERVRRP
jgi:ADP-heptose:LPS heptosyltransferase